MIKRTAGTPNPRVTAGSRVFSTLERRDGPRHRDGFADAHFSDIVNSPPYEPDAVDLEKKTVTVEGSGGRVVTVDAKRRV